MAESKSTRSALDKGLLRIDEDLRACRQTLMCAAEALSKAEDELFRGESGELGVAAVHVVERCTRELLRIEESVDRLRVEAGRP